MRLARVIDLTLPLFASSIAVAFPTDTANIDPAISEITISGCNSTEPVFGLKILEPSSQINQRIVARQSGCPSPSTDSFCRTGYCFLSSRYEGSTWGTCCPAGWSLWWIKRYGRSKSAVLQAHQGLRVMDRRRLWNLMTAAAAGRFLVGLVSMRSR